VTHDQPVVSTRPVLACLASSVPAKFMAAKRPVEGWECVASVVEHDRQTEEVAVKCADHLGQSDGSQENAV
jgi:hypothetical protein